MELVAALVSSKVVAMLTEELDIPDLDATFWTDSNVVLGYIHNDVKRFRTFVANRAKKIRSPTSKDQWNYINTDYNPADDASRGLSIEDSERVKRWFEGPQFLWEKDFPVGNGSNEAKIPDNDPEVLVISKNCSVQLITYNVSFLENIEERISNWMRIKRVLAIVILFIEKLRKRRKPDEGLNVEDIEKAEQTILSEIQRKQYNAEIELLQKGKPIRRSSSIGKLDPFIDDQGLIRVGGRMRKSGLNADIKHPVILPKKVMFVQRIIEWYHRQVQHLGRTTTLNELRSHRYWIMSAGAQVRSVISRCFLCKLYRGRCLTQKMADLPADRMEDAPPFTYCGVDMFGPFLIKERRSELKRYGMIYTCMSCRAIHLETVNSADTDSFILSLRRFLARRGPVRSMRSDNGGNFIGADAEMVENLKKMDRQKIKEFLLERSCDWLDWERNPAESSHMGGIWERQIRSVKNVLSSLLKEHAARLDDESLRTLLTEVESIVNSRPLSVEGLNDCSIEPLTPNHLLTMKSKVVLPPPGVFQKADVYCRKRWRTVQYLANQFWNRWRKEFLMTLQERNKWRDKQLNLKVGDIVLVKDADTPRNKWPMGRICEAIPGDDGLVRKVIIKRSDSDILISRSVTKVVLLMKSTNDA